MGKERKGWDQQEKGEKAESELRRASPAAVTTATCES